jgi:hypothetical protein
MEISGEARLIRRPRDKSSCLVFWALRKLALEISRSFMREEVIYSLKLLGILGVGCLNGSVFLNTPIDVLSGEYSADARHNSGEITVTNSTAKYSIISVSTFTG